MLLNSFRALTTQVKFANQASYADNHDYYQINCQKKTCKANDKVTCNQQRINIVSNSRQDHKVVLENQKEALVDNFQGFACRCIIEVHLGNVGYVQQSHKEHQQDLNLWELEEGKSDGYEDRSTQEKHCRIRANS